MSLHLEFEPHSWYMGFAIKRNTSWAIEDDKAYTYTAVTDNGMTGYINTIESYTLEELKTAIRSYHLTQHNGYGERIAKRRLEYLRGELREGTMSYGELAELQSLTKYIEDGDIELLEGAGVPEHEQSDENIQSARDAVDEAITEWLRLNGIDNDTIMKLDYSDIDNELNALLNNDGEDD